MLRRNGTRGYEAERLATEFEVSVRTVKRDLAAPRTRWWVRIGVECIPAAGHPVAGAGSAAPPSPVPRPHVRSSP
ncbi:MULTISPECIES: HTH domain-containing protein [unclassified Microbacterium]|uniref:HTH domain-containing protein n=1 Tax=Microbacterium sp. Se63.02b TaxID=2709304 RepID=UPI001FCF19CD|nr:MULTISPECIES: HTH domain-containing protein [unclassified Microbacterium]